MDVKQVKRNNIIIAGTLIVCMIVCILWATVFFVRRAKAPSESSSDVSVESSLESSEEMTELPDALDALFACNDRVLRASSFASSTKGHCDTQVMFFGFRHEIRGERYANGNELYCSDIGYGSHIRYSVSAYCKGDTRLVRLGDINPSSEVIWNEKPISLSEHAYADAMGGLHRGLSMYMLDKNSVLSAKLKSFTEDTYTFVYELDPSLASPQYAKKLQALGALEETPVFDSVKMTVVTDHLFYPITVTYEESYSVMLSMVGKTACKAEYTESFDAFEESVTIPDQTFFDSFLSLDATDTCPALSAGYQLLLSLFEDLTVYELTISTPALELPMELYTDMTHGALRLHSDLFDFLYQNERYHLSHGEIHVFTEAQALNEQLLPLFSAVHSQGRAKNDTPTDLFADAEIKTENGILYISSANDGMSFSIAIDTANMSLLNAEITADLSGSVCEIRLTKTDQKTNLPDAPDYVDISDSVSALSFLTTLLGENDLRYTLQTNGVLSYQADLIISTDHNLAFSALSSAEEIPIDLYFADQELCAVWGDVSVFGTLDEFGSLLSAFSNNGGVSVASEQAETRLVSLSHDTDQITLVFGGQTPFSVTLTSESAALCLDSVEIFVHYSGISQVPPIAAPAVTNALSASALSSFLQDSFYTTLNGEGSIGASLSLDFGGQSLEGDLLLNLSSDLSARFDTELGGVETSVIFKNDTVYLSNSILNAFVELDRIESVLQRLAPLSEQAGAIPISAEAVEHLLISCDGNELVIRYNGTIIALHKQSITIVNDQFSLRARNLYQLSESMDFSVPSKKDAIDLDRLSERIVPLFGQTSFSFKGTLIAEDFYISIARLDFCLEQKEISRAAIDLSINSSLHHIVYCGDAFYLENDNVKLFCLAQPLLAYIGSQGTPQAAAYRASTQPDLASIRSVSYQNDILIIKSDDFTLSAKLTKQGIDSLELTVDSMKLSLQAKEHAAITVPALDGYVDVTGALELLPSLVNTVEAGSFDFEGCFDLEVSTLRLKGIALDGTLDFSDGSLKGYFCMDVPYLYGLTSGDISLKQGNSLLKSCNIKSEIFILNDQVYLCRTVYATYGYTQTLKLKYTEKRYLSIQELISSPENFLAFVLHLDPALVSPASETAPQQLRSASSRNLLKRFAYIDGKYMLEFHPDMLSAVDSLAVYAKTERNLISRVGIETTVSALNINVYCDLTEHGNAQLEFTKRDFTDYIPLQD